MTAGPNSWRKDLPLPPAEVWDLMWRRETQRRWLGEGPAIRLEAGARCALADEAGPWRSARIVDVADASRVALEVDRPAAWALGEATSVTIVVEPDGDGGSVVTVSEDGLEGRDAEESARFWTRRLDRLRSIAGRVRRRRGDVRQAVVVIHGIGEQQPGDTLHALLDGGVLPGVSDDEGVWVKPDRVSGSYELRRIAIKGSDERGLPATDVYELYWAHLIQDTTLGQIWAWVRRLLWRGWRAPPLRPVVVLAWTLMLAALATGVALVLGAEDVTRWLGGGTLVAVVATGAWRLFGRGLAVNVLGDAARYLLPLPSNIARRQAIREAGVALLERLHESGDYDRIVILGHSLGSVIAYDIVTHAWIEMNGVHRRPRHATFGEVRALERAITADHRPMEAQRLQHDAWQRQRVNTQPWLVTDLVTVGSPLTHAALLMAASDDAFEATKRGRVLPTCPPQTELEKKSGHLRASYDPGYHDPITGDSLTFTVFHHGAPFAVTRWTNLYFEAGVLGLTGDVIGGPVAPVFGGWVRDVPLPSPARRFTHTWYWRPHAGSCHVAALRAALRLNSRHDLVELLDEIPAFSFFPAR